MTQLQARSAADALKGAMNRWGVTCSIELQSGRGTDPWGVYIKYHRMWHHTVSTYKPGGNLTPVLGIVKKGRSDVPGPLANGYIGYDRIFRIICMGEANHPGLGGPITIDGVRIPQNSARKPTFGIEVEGGLQTWEDIDDLGPDMLEVMGRADNALAEWSSRPLTSQMEHKTWAPERKVDRKDFDAARTRGIALTRKWHTLIASPPEEDLDATQNQKLNEIHAAVFGSQQGKLLQQIWATEVAHLPTVSGAAADLLRKININAAACAATGSDVDEAAVAAAILAVLTPEAIAAAIPDSVAVDVADELAARLTG